MNFFTPHSTGTHTYYIICKRAYNKRFAICDASPAYSNSRPSTSLQTRAKITTHDYIVIIHGEGCTSHNRNVSISDNGNVFAVPKYRILTFFIPCNQINTLNKRLHLYYTHKSAALAITKRAKHRLLYTIKKKMQPSKLFR